MCVTISGIPGAGKKIPGELKFSSSPGKESNVSIFYFSEARSSSPIFTTSPAPMVISMSSAARFSFR